MTVSCILMTIGSIILIDLALGGDNALVIALACINLSDKQQKRVMVWYIIFAIAIRGILSSLAIFLLQIPLLQYAGGMVLIWVAIKLLRNDKGMQVESQSTVWDALKTILIADTIMGIDNVIAIAGAANGSIPMVIFGLSISIPLIVIGSKVIIKYLEQYPSIVYIGASVLAWTAGRVIVGDQILYKLVGIYIPFYHTIIPICALIAVLSYGLYHNRDWDTQKI